MPLLRLFLERFQEGSGGDLAPAGGKVFGMRRQIINVLFHDARRCAGIERWTALQSFIEHDAEGINVIGRRWFLIIPDFRRNVLIGSCQYAGAGVQ